MRYIIACLVVLSLTACATTSGVKLDNEKLSHFVKGKTTYTEVVREIGEPDSLMTDDQFGLKIASYSYGHNKVDAASYIPYVGGLLGGSENERQTVQLQFDKNSKYLGSVVMGTGLKHQSSNPFK